ncbi:cytochrome P450 [Nitriliruptoraceae bacterium ZYF776]|nr:cytochrome P450 [Profundirhabdus halotolerans]
MSLEALVGLDPAERRCPYHTYAQLREAGVRYAPELDAYVVSRYEDVVRVLRDHGTFSSVGALGRPPRDPDASGPNDSPLLLLSDQPDHARFRAIVNRAFTPARVRAWEPAIRQLCDDLIDGFVDEEHVEFVAAFSGTLPIAVITNVLGVPRSEAATFRRYSEQLTSSLGSRAEGENAPAAIAREFSGHIHPLVDAAVGVESEHILPVIAEAREAGVLTAEESTRFVMELIIAGNITTAHHLTSSVMQLARAPEVADRLRRDPAGIPAFIEESLRTESPIQAFYRLAREDAEVGGVTVPAGQRVFVIYGSGNRDPDLWDDADAFDLERDRPQRHLAFGKGIHTCLGAPLARAEGRIAIEQLLARLPDFAIDGADDDLPWLESFVNHGPTQLPLKLGSVRDR